MVDAFSSSREGVVAVVVVSFLSFLPSSTLNYIAMKSSPSPTLRTLIPIKEEELALPPAARGGMSEPQISLETETSQQSNGSADAAAKATSAGAGGAGIEAGAADAPPAASLKKLSFP